MRIDSEFKTLRSRFHSFISLIQKRMRPFTGFFFLILLGSAANSIPAYSQVSPTSFAGPSNTSTFWLISGLGPSSVHASLSLSANWRDGYFFASTRYTTHSEFLPGGATFFEGSVLGGVAYVDRRFHTSIGIGPDVCVGIKSRDVLGPTKADGIETFGLALDAQLFVNVTPQVGVGVHGYGSLNKDYNFYGFSLALKWQK